MNKQDKYDSLFRFYAEKYKLDWLLLKAQSRQESSLNPNALNRGSQAKGLGQIIPGTFNEWCKRLKICNADPFNPEHSIWIQAAYMDWLRTYLDKYLEDKTNLIEFMLAAYNWGIRYIRNLIRAGNSYKQAFNKMPDETRNYIDNINDYYLAYRCSPINMEVKQHELPKNKFTTLGKGS